LKGVAPDAKIIICKVFSDYGPYAYSADIVAAIEYLIQLKQNGVNVVAANMSLGSDKGFDDPTDPEQKAVKNGYLAELLLQFQLETTRISNMLWVQSISEQTLMASTLPTLKTQHE